MPSFAGELGEGEVRDVIAYMRSLQQTALLARDAPGAEACTVAPRTLEGIVALGQGAAPAEPPNATETGASRPMRQRWPRSRRRRARWSPAPTRAISCAGSPSTATTVSATPIPHGPTKALQAIADQPLPLALPDRVALLGVEDVRVLPDGRVIARVKVDNPAMHSHDPNVAAASRRNRRRRG